MEETPGLSRGLGISELSGDAALDPLPADPPKPKGKPARVEDPELRLPAVDLESLGGSASEGEGADPFRFGLGCASPSLGDESFDGKRGVKE